jgi:UDP-N-acetylmuramate--alanine ligase
MRIYFSGIGGVGIGPLAEIALDAGYAVVGSDMAESLVTRELEERGIAISYDQS